MHIPHFRNDPYYDVYRTSDFCVRKKRAKIAQILEWTSVWVHLVCKPGWVSQWVYGLMCIWIFMYLRAITSDPCLESFVSCGYGLVRGMVVISISFRTQSSYLKKPYFSYFSKALNLSELYMLHGIVARCYWKIQAIGRLREALGKTKLLLWQFWITLFIKHELLNKIDLIKVDYVWLIKTCPPFYPPKRETVYLKCQMWKMKCRWKQ